MMIVAMNPEILTRFHRTCVVPLRFLVSNPQRWKSEVSDCLLIVVVVVAVRAIIKSTRVSLLVRCPGYTNNDNGIQHS